MLHLCVCIVSHVLSRCTRFVGPRVHRPLGFFTLTKLSRSRLWTVACRFVFYRDRRGCGAAMARPCRGCGLPSRLESRDVHPQEGLEKTMKEFLVDLRLVVMIR